MSNEFQVFSGGFIADSRGASATGAAREEGWLAAPFGDGEPGEDAESGGTTGASFDAPFVLSLAAASFALGLVMGMADLGTARTTAFARARW